MELGLRAPRSPLSNRPGSRGKLLSFPLSTDFPQDGCVIFKLMFESAGRLRVIGAEKLFRDCETTLQKGFGVF